MGLSTHVLDTARGAPAAGVAIVVDRFDAGSWQHIASAETDSNGRCARLLATNEDLISGRYRLRFETAAYFAKLESESGTDTCFYPYVEVVFTVRDQRHHHIPLLIAANGYTTYRGS